MLHHPAQLFLLKAIVFKFQKGSQNYWQINKEELFFFYLLKSSVWKLPVVWEAWDYPRQQSVVDRASFLEF